MRVITRKPFLEAEKKYPNDAEAIKRTYKILEKGDFRSPDKLKAVFPTLDNFKYKDKWWIIDIGGNNLRLMAFILYEYNCMYVKHIVPHAEYNRLCERYKKEGD